MDKLITENGCYTQAQFTGAIARLAAYLQTQGIAKESKVGFIAETTPATIALFFALFHLKAIACPLSHRLPPHQIPACVEQLTATHFLNVSTLPFIPEPVPFFEYDWDPQCTATFLFTSGSSGTPKIACHTLGNHLSSAASAIGALDISHSTRYLLSLPLFHVSGISILFRWMLSQCVLVLSNQPPARSLNAYRITHTSFVPTQLFRILQDPNLTLPSLRCGLVGGAPLSSSLESQAFARGIPLFTTYGMTEMSSMITFGKQGQGKALPHCLLQAAPDTEVLVQGPSLFQGYWDTHLKRPHLPLKEGWFATGDLGRQTEEGTWEITGRKDRLFISGGENIQPEEIERALCSVPGIFSARVVPQADPEFGHRPIAYVLEENPQHTLSSIKEALATRLPSFKHPVAVYPFTSLMKEGLKVPLKPQE